MAKAKLKTAQANAARKAKSVALQKERQGKLAKLKKLGLFTGDSRKAAKSSRGGRIIAQFSGVLDGSEAAVKVDKRTASGKAALAAQRAAGGSVRGDRIIVPKATPGETIRFDKRTGQLVGKRVQHGAYWLRRISFTPVFDPEKLPRTPEGQVRFYSFRAPRKRGGFGGTQRFEDRQAFIDWMSGYRNATEGSLESREKFKQFWTSHTVIEEVVGYTGGKIKNEYGPDLDEGGDD